MLCVRLRRAGDHPGAPAPCLPFKVHFTGRLSLGKHCMCWLSYSAVLSKGEPTTCSDSPLFHFNHQASWVVFSSTHTDNYIHVINCQLRNILMLVSKKKCMACTHKNITVSAFKAFQFRQKQISKLFQEVKLWCDNKPTVRVITGRGAVLGQL